MWTTVVVKWVIHMQRVMHIYSGTYVINVKYMYTSACSDIADCIKFIWGIYTVKVVTCAHEVIGYVWHLKGIFVVADIWLSMENKSCSLLVVLSDLYVQ